MRLLGAAAGSRGEGQSGRDVLDVLDGGAAQTAHQAEYDEAGRTCVI